MFTNYYTLTANVEDGIRLRRMSQPSAKKEEKKKGFNVARFSLAMASLPHHSLTLPLNALIFFIYSFLFYFMAYSALFNHDAFRSTLLIFMLLTCAAVLRSRKA